MREWFNVLQYRNNWNFKDSIKDRKPSIRRKRRASDTSKDSDQGLSSKHLNKLKPLLMSNFSDTPLHTQAPQDTLDISIGEKVEKMAIRVKNRASLPPPNKLHQNTYAYDIHKLAELRDSDVNYESVRQVLGKECNTLCADCRTPAPLWASHSLNNIPMVIFICIQCSGWHRSLGSHISKVKSVELDDWSSELIALAETTGNDKCNGYWEASMPSVAIPTPSNAAQIGEFIRNKYMHQLWVDSNITFTAV